jgi:hypothetical protein
VLSRRTHRRTFYESGKIQIRPQLLHSKCDLHLKGIPAGLRSPETRAKGEQVLTRHIEAFKDEPVYDTILKICAKLKQASETFAFNTQRNPKWLLSR